MDDMKNVTAKLILEKKVAPNWRLKGPLRKDKKKKKKVWKKKMFTWNTGEAKDFFVYVVIVEALSLSPSPVYYLHPLQKKKIKK